MFDSIAHLLQKPSLSVRHACVEEIRSEIERGTDLADCIRVHIESQLYAQAEVHYVDAEDYLTHMSKSASLFGSSSKQTQQHHVPAVTTTSPPRNGIRSVVSKQK